jgi:hypothetical protein
VSLPRSLDQRRLEPFNVRLMLALHQRPSAAQLARTRHRFAPSYLREWKSHFAAFVSAPLPLSSGVRMSVPSAHSRENETAAAARSSTSSRSCKGARDRAALTVVTTPLSPKRYALRLQCEEGVSYLKSGVHPESNPGRLFPGRALARAAVLGVLGSRIKSVDVPSQRACIRLPSGVLASSVSRHGTQALAMLG